MPTSRDAAPTARRDACVRLESGIFPPNLLTMSTEKTSIAIAIMIVDKGIWLTGRRTILHFLARWKMETWDVRCARKTVTQSVTRKIALRARKTVARCATRKMEERNVN